jgi:hypothetical protein
MNFKRSLRLLNFYYRLLILSRKDANVPKWSCM